ncbi:hypothetical protein OKW43_005588 [Paraburkholderia sp. WC7.3g]|uniref:hypothetical protein n=1 Tax=Paraburkholderia sp. WC7.3g TaxID=2991070 RepID=UPI003D193BB1
MAFFGGVLERSGAQTAREPGWVDSLYKASGNRAEGKAGRFSAPGKGRTFYRLARSAYYLAPRVVGAGIVNRPAYRATE